MTLEQALEVLGLDASATAEERKRAYLRLVKKHKPDADPAGFQRIREAYECATAWVAPSAESAFADDGAGSGDAPAEAEAGSAPAAPATSERPTAPDPSLDLAAEARRVAGIRERVRSLVGEGKTSAAARYLALELETGKWSCVPLLAPSCGLVFSVIGHGDPSGGRQLVRALQKNLELTGTELEGLRAVGPQWLVARELVELPTSFPAELLSALTGGYLGNDFTATRQTFIDYIGKSEGRARVLDELQKLAPTVHAHLNLVFRKPKRRALWQVAGLRHPAWLPLLLILPTVIRWIGSEVFSTSNTPTPSYLSTPANQERPAQSPQQQLQAERFSALATELSSAAHDTRAVQPSLAELAASVGRSFASAGAGACASRVDDGLLVVAELRRSATSNPTFLGHAKKIEDALVLLCNAAPAPTSIDKPTLMLPLPDGGFAP